MVTLILIYIFFIFYSPSSTSESSPPARHASLAPSSPLSRGADWEVRLDRKVDRHRLFLNSCFFKFFSFFHFLRFFRAFRVFLFSLSPPLSSISFLSFSFLSFSFLSFSFLFSSVSLRVTGRPPQWCCSSFHHHRCWSRFFLS